MLPGTVLDTGRFMLQKIRELRWVRESDLLMEVSVGWWLFKEWLIEKLGGGSWEERDLQREKIGRVKYRLEHLSFCIDNHMPDDVPHYVLDEISTAIQELEEELE